MNPSKKWDDKDDGEIPLIQYRVGVILFVSAITMGLLFGAYLVGESLAVCRSCLP